MTTINISWLIYTINCIWIQRTNHCNHRRNKVIFTVAAEIRHAPVEPTQF